MRSVTFSSAERHEISQLASLLAPEDTGPDPLGKHFTALAGKILGRPISVTTATDKSFSEPGHRIQIGLFEVGDERSLGYDRWLAAQLGAFWHELGHELYTRPDTYVPVGLGVAFNLLEDGRIERRLVDEYPDSKVWLEHNFLVSRSDEHMRDRVAEHGWPFEAVLIGSRIPSGVTTWADLDGVASRLHESPPAADLVNAWSMFASLPDDSSPADRLPHLSSVDPIVPPQFRWDDR